MRSHFQKRYNVFTLFSTLSILISLAHLVQSNISKFRIVVFPNENSSHVMHEIEWLKSSNWEQVINKAGMENKYIFVDCYTTWCAPCKKMDELVFRDKEVVSFINKKYLAIKIQMDSSLRDDDHVKSWYGEASKFKEEYRIHSYPTFLFFNPQGELVEKVSGFKRKDNLIDIAKSALLPGQKYVDQFSGFYSLIDQYKRGIKYYSKMPQMIRDASRLGLGDVAVALRNDLHKHLNSLPQEQLMVKEYLEFIVEYGSANSNLVNIFFPYNNKVDSLMGRDGYSNLAINEMIRRDYIKEFLGGSGQLGVYKSRKDSIIPKQNWSSLFETLERRFDNKLAEINVLWAKFRWYDYNRDMQKAKVFFIELVTKFGIDALSIKMVRRNNLINHIAWQCGVLETATHKDMTQFISMLSSVIDDNIKVYGECATYQYIDTYAHLLYKVGNRQEAIAQQERALKIYQQCLGAIPDKNLDATYKSLKEAYDKMLLGKSL